VTAPSLRRWVFPVVVVAAAAVAALAAPELGQRAGRTIGYGLREMLLFLPPIFVLLGLLDVWVPREHMLRAMGPGSGIRGGALAFALGSAAMGPLYAAFPIAAMLLRKGAALVNVLIFIGAWSTTKIPMFLFELGALGPAFAVTRLLVDIPAIVLIAFALTRLLGPREVEALYARHSEDADRRSAQVRREVHVAQLRRRAADLIEEPTQVAVRKRPGSEALVELALPGDQAFPQGPRLRLHLGVETSDLFDLLRGESEVPTLSEAEDVSGPRDAVELGRLREPPAFAVAELADVLFGERLDRPPLLARVGRAKSGVSRSRAALLGDDGGRRGSQTGCDQREASHRPLTSRDKIPTRGARRQSCRDAGIVLGSPLRSGRFPASQPPPGCPPAHDVENVLSALRGL
jgi:hypothetical protein